MIRKDNNVKINKPIKINKAITFFCVVLVFVFALWGCKTPDNKNLNLDSVVVALPTDSEPAGGFNPIYGWGGGEHVHEPLIQSTLTRTTNNLKIENDLAVDYTVSENGLIWKVTIRDDVYFTDGKKLTAGDVAFTYNECCKESTINDLSMLDFAAAKSDTEVEFHLNRPFSIWPYTMATIGIVPEHAYDENYGNNPIGSGRYILEKWDVGQQVILKANPNYYGGEAKMKQVTILFMEEEAALAAVMSKDVDVAYTSPALIDTKVDDFFVMAVETVDNRGFNLPAVSEQKLSDGTVIGNDFTKDAAVRRAINIGIDRNKLIKNVLNGYGKEAYSVCDNLPWYNEASKVTYDLAAAKEILSKDGWLLKEDGIRYKDNKKAQFTLMYPASDLLRQALAEEVKNQLKNLGIEVSVKEVNWDSAYKDALSQPLIWGWGAHTPMELYNIYHTDAKNEYARYSPYSNKTVDKYMDEALMAKELEASYELWKKSQWDGSEGITQQGDIPWVWLCNVNHLYFVKDNLQVAKQKIHPHGHGWSIVNNVDEWTRSDE